MINVLDRKNLDDFDEFSLLKFSRLCSLLVLLESPDILHSGPQYGALVLSDILSQAIVSAIIYSLIKLSTFSAFSLLKVSICQLRCYQCSG